MVNPVWRLMGWRADRIVSGSTPLALARLAWSFAALDVRGAANSNPVLCVVSVSSL
jgi:hypothetical protein